MHIIKHTVQNRAIDAKEEWALNENERVYHAVSTVGVSDIVIGVVVIAVGIAAGVVAIVNGARLLVNRRNIML